MDFLARREHGRAELKGKLVQRGVDEQIADNIVTQLANEGLQDDTRFAEMYIRAQTARGKGPLYIRNGLHQRGFSSADAEEALAQSDFDWTESATSVARKKFGEGACNYSERAGRMRFLLQRGFTPEQCNVALKNIES